MATSVTEALQYHVARVALTIPAQNDDFQYHLPKATLAALSTLAFSYGAKVLPVEMVNLAKHRKGGKSPVVEEQVRLNRR